MNKLPNFIVIGAGKSGTTSLYEYLSEHPEVFMSPVKETNFFALEGTQMVNPENDPDQMFHYPWSVTNMEDYKELFSNSGDAKAIGEVSPMYLYSPRAAEEIKKNIPNVKLVAILRDPVDRLYSRYMHLVRERREPSEKFEDSLSRETIWWKRNDLIQEGFYHTHLSNYYKHFDESQIRVYLYDDFRKNPQEVIQDIYEFIGVDPSFVSDMSTEYNVSGKIKNATVDKFIGQDSVLKKIIGRISPSLVMWIKNQPLIKKLIYSLRKKNLEKAPIATETRGALIKEVYQNEILNLQNLIGRDLSNWMSITK